MLATAFALTLALAPAQVKEPAARDYAQILSDRVKNGRVAYKTVKEKDLAKLDSYLAAVAEAKVPSDRLQAIGFYVDAYNANVIRQVIAHDFPRSVLDVKGFFDDKVVKVAGKTVSLNQLEKEILNPFAKDPRTHMVLVCGAVGCPILEETPYAGSDVNTRLDAAAKRYMSGPTGAQSSPGELRLSHILDWYKTDFGGDEGALAFARKYASKDALERAGATPKITYIDYNWTLNAQ
jgi:hypothetical protein